MRLIDADAVYEILESCEIKKDTYGSLLNDWDHGYNCGIERAESEIECAPTIDAVPIRHGKWITKSTGGEYFDCCSECGYIEWDSPNNYCPNCGARMDEVQE